MIERIAVIKPQDEAPSSPKEENRSLLLNACNQLYGLALNKRCVFTPNLLEDNDLGVLPAQNDYPTSSQNAFAKSFNRGLSIFPNSAIVRTGISQSDFTSYDHYLHNFGIADPIHRIELPRAYRVTEDIIKQAKDLPGIESIMPYAQKTAFRELAAKHGFQPAFNLNDHAQQRYDEIAFKNTFTKILHSIEADKTNLEVLSIPSELSASEFYIYQARLQKILEDTSPTPVKNNADQSVVLFLQGNCGGGGYGNNLVIKDALRGFGVVHNIGAEPQQYFTSTAALLEGLVALGGVQASAYQQVIDAFSYAIVPYQDEFRKGLMLWGPRQNIINPDNNAYLGWRFDLNSNTAYDANKNPALLGLLDYFEANQIYAPAGIDAFSFRNKDGDLCVKLAEINPRLTACDFLMHSIFKSKFLSSAWSQGKISMMHHEYIDATKALSNKKSDETVLTTAIKLLEDRNVPLANLKRGTPGVMLASIPTESFPVIVLQVIADSDYQRDQWFYMACDVLGSSTVNC